MYNNNDVYITASVADNGDYLMYAGVVLARDIDTLNLSLIFSCINSILRPDYDECISFKKVKSLVIDDTYMHIVLEFTGNREEYMIHQRANFLMHFFTQIDRINPLSKHCFPEDFRQWFSVWP